jgi:hypothetical protein
VTCAKAVLICLDLAFWFIAVVSSLWYRKHAIEAFNVGSEDRTRIAGSPVCQRHERWFNFFGSLAGWWALWIVLYELYLRRLPVEAVHVALILIAFVGISGYLPYMIKYKTSASLGK